MKNTEKPLNMTERFKPRPKTVGQMAALPDVPDGVPILYDRERKLHFVRVRKNGGPATDLPVGGAHRSIAELLKSGWELA